MFISSHICLITWLSLFIYLHFFGAKPKRPRPNSHHSGPIPARPPGLCIYFTCMAGKNFSYACMWAFSNCMVLTQPSLHLHVDHVKPTPPTTHRPPASFSTCALSPLLSPSPRPFSFLLWSHLPNPLPLPLHRPTSHLFFHHSRPIPFSLLHVHSLPHLHQSHTEPFFSSLLDETMDTPIFSLPTCLLHQKHTGVGL